MPTFLDEPEDVTPSTGSWQDVDVTAHVSGAVAGVLLQIVNTSTTTNYVGEVRCNGSVDDHSSTHKVRIESLHWVAVGVDADDIFEAYVENTAVHIWLVGYFTDDEAVFFVDSQAVQPASHDSTWRDINIASLTGDDTALLALGYVFASTAGDRGASVRPNGSSDDFGKNVRQSCSYGFFAPCDESEIYECWSNSSGNAFRLLGYMIANFTSTGVNGIDKHPGTNNVFNDIDCTGDVDAGSTAVLLKLYATDSADRDWSLRKNGGSFDEFWEAATWAMPIVELDGDLIYEAKTNANVQAKQVIYGSFGSGNVAAEPTGVEGTGAVGTAVATASAVAAITGVSGTGQVGTAVAAFADGVTVVGVQGTGHAGTVTTGGDVVAAVTGVFGTGQVGAIDILAGQIVPVTGVEGTGAVGTVGTQSAYGVEGVSGVGSAGEVIVRQLFTGDQIDPGHKKRVRSTPNRGRYDRRPS